jgi:hypothetical protein
VQPARAAAARAVVPAAAAFASVTGVVAVAVAAMARICAIAAIAARALGGRQVWEAEDHKARDGLTHFLAEVDQPEASTPLPHRPVHFLSDAPYKVYRAVCALR